VRPVNLLPTRYRPARASGERSGIGYIAIGVLAVLFLMVLLYVVTNNGIDDAKQKTASAQAEQQAAAARIGSLQAYGDFASVKTARETAVKGVADSRFDYERLMREVALVLPHDSYLTAFSSAPGGSGAAAPAATGATTTTATGPTVTMTGCAPSHRGVANVVVRLRQLHNVASVDLTSSTKGGASGAATTTSACPVTWNGTVTLEAESAPTATTPVPARLGGGQ
jgi:Tfp pilus assembly protein PilN